MLLWSRTSRGVVAALLGLVVLVVVVAPLATLLVAALARSWTGVLPGAWTGAHLADAVSGDDAASLLVSVQTALVAGVVSVLLGTWVVLAAERAPRAVRVAVTATCALPVAVPSVVVGLGLLIAFNRPPLLLGGTLWIVVLAHAVLVLAFTVSTVQAGLTRLDPVYPDAAASLGAGPTRVLLTVRLPLLLPSITAAAGLAVALSMGELGATIMVYPPSWRTFPITIFAQSDRGEAFAAAAATVVLVVATGLLLLLLGRVRTRR